MVETRWSKGSGDISRRRAYPLLGALLAMGAPLGLLLLRSVLASRFPTAGWVAAEVRGDPATYAYLLVSTSVVFAILGSVLGALVDELAQSSTTDSLTGLANRRSFDERLAHEVERAARHGTPLSVLLVDVDGLKKVNDEGGHEAGDAALRAVAEGLRRSCRRTDLAARTGGDEFGVLAPMTTAARALELASRIRATLASLPAAMRAPTVSIGIADLASAGSSSPESITSAADAALYRAKTAGRDRAVVAITTEPRSTRASREARVARA
jgi:diguanylate cyclase (GGDEF)-like protein